jgi:hypothetical protein
MGNSKGAGTESANKSQGRSSKTKAVKAYRIWIKWRYAQRDISVKHGQNKIFSAIPQNDITTH